MLANLTVRAWSARKRDKTIGREVEVAHQATDAGNFNKLLIDKAAIKPIVTLSGQLRDLHYKMTLPWGDNGDRLLPSAMYFEYTKAMRDMRDTFHTAVKTFVANYPTYKQEARKRLGTMYNAEDYPDPSHITAKFEARVSFLPVPEAKDFRVDLGADEVAQIREDIEKEVALRQAEAVNDLWTRLKDVIEHAYNRLSDPEAIFRDSLIENIQSLCSIAAKLNITNDAKLEEVRKDAQHRLCGVPAQRLRDDKVLRKNVANAAADILKSFPVG